MSKAEEKTTELMKKAKDFIPDGGYSEKELNLAFFMFIKGYHQAEKDLELTWEDIKVICDIAFEEACRLQRNMKSSHIYKEQHYKEVLKQFKVQKGE